MQEIKVHTWCDPHPEAEKTPAEKWTVTLQPPEMSAPLAFKIDLCPVCRTPYDNLLAELIEYGVPESPASKRKSRSKTPGEPPPSPELPAQCEAPGCEYAPLSMSAYKTHASSTHDLTPAELSGEATIPCPAPGCDRKFVGTQGRFTHVRTQHPDQPDLLVELRQAS